MKTGNRNKKIMLMIFMLIGVMSVSLELLPRHYHRRWYKDDHGYYYVTRRGRNRYYKGRRPYRGPYYDQNYYYAYPGAAGVVVGVGGRRGGVSVGVGW